MTEKSVGQAVDRFLDDREDADNTRQLNDWISTDPTHANTAFRRFLLHVLLEQHYVQQRMRRRLGMADPIEDAPTRRGWLTTRWAIISLLTVLSVTVIVLSIVLAYSFFEWSARYDPVAAAVAARQNVAAAAPSPFLTTDADALWAPGFKIPTGLDDLFGVKMDLLQGLAAINYRNGNQVIMQGPASMTAEREGRVRLEAGAISLDFTNAKSQMILTTPQADIFAAQAVLAAAIRDQQLFVRLLKGTAQIKLRRDSQPRPLNSGELICIRSGSIESRGDEPSDAYFGPAAQSILSLNASRHPAMPVIYDGFAYPAAVTADQQNAARATGLENLAEGWGWDGPWHELGAVRSIVRTGDADAAAARAGILAFADSSSSVLLRQGGQLSVGLEDRSITTRTVNTSAFPSRFVDDRGVGANGSSIWISFLACMFDSTSADSIGYLQLGDGRRGVRIGKLPGAKNNWAVSSLRERGEQIVSEVDCGRPALIVAEVIFRAGAEHVLVWINPDGKKNPKPATASMQMFVPDFRLREVSIIGRGSVDFDELRVGTSYGAVAPFEK